MARLSASITWMGLAMTDRAVKVLVRRDALNESTDVDVTGCYIIEIGEGRTRIGIAVREGRIVINANGCLDVRPEGTNAVSLGVWRS